MARSARRKRPRPYTVVDLRELAEAVAVAVSSRDYVPTLRDPGMATAFDAAMGILRDPRRAWPRQQKGGG